MKSGIHYYFVYLVVLVALLPLSAFVKEGTKSASWGWITPIPKFDYVTEGEYDVGGEDLVHVDPFARVEPLEPLEKTIIALPKSTTWSRGVQSLLEVVTGDSAIPWDAPPAQMRCDEFPEPNVPESLDLVLGMWKLEELEVAQPERGDIQLVIRAHEGEPSELALEPLQITVHPMSKDTVFHIWVRWYVRGGWFSRATNVRLTEIVQVPASSLSQGKPWQAEIKVLEDKPQELSTALPSKIPTRLRFMPGHMTARSSSAVDGKPVKIDVGRMKSWGPYDSSIDYHDMRGAENLLLATEGMHLACMVWADTDIRKRLVCRRSSNGEPVGRFAEKLPVFVAAADGRDSLLLRLFAADSDDSFKFNVIANSGNEDIRKAFLINALGYLPFNRKGIPVTKQDMDLTVHWLMEVLGIQLDDKDLEFLSQSGGSFKPLADYFKGLTGEVPESEQRETTLGEIWKKHRPSSKWFSSIKSFNEMFAYPSTEAFLVPAAQSTALPEPGVVPDPDDHDIYFASWHFEFLNYKPSKLDFRVCIRGHNNNYTTISVNGDSYVTTNATVDAKQIAFYVVWHQPGGWLSSAVDHALTEHVFVSLEDLEQDSGARVQASVPQAIRSKLSQLNLPEELEFKIRVLPDEPNTWSKKGTIRPSGLDKELVSSKRSVSYLNARGTDTLTVANPNRYVAVAVICNEDLRRNLACWRIDTEERIGVWAPKLPLFLAFAGNRASLRLCCVCTQPTDHFDYTVFALGDMTDLRKPFFFHLLGHLMGLEDGRAPYGKRDIDETVLWMLDALGIEFTKEELRQAFPGQEDVARLFRYLEDIGGVK